MRFEQEIIIIGNKYAALGKGCNHSISPFSCPEGAHDVSTLAISSIFMTFIEISCGT